MTNISNVEKDNDGFLLDPSDWNTLLAETIAEEFDIPLEKEHWIVIEFIRYYFDKYQKVPELRELLKSFKKEYGEKALEEIDPETLTDINTIIKDYRNSKTRPAGIVTTHERTILPIELRSR